MHYFPLAWPFLLGLFLLFAFLVALVQLGILRYAYEKVGISRQHAFTLLLLSLFGSYVNIPVSGFRPSGWRRVATFGFSEFTISSRSSTIGRERLSPSTSAGR